MQKNRHGIPVVNSKPFYTERCSNKRTGQLKYRFPSRFIAERFLAESIHPSVRDTLEVYICGDHYHFATKMRHGRAD
jgi:hypothetical protein